MRSYLRIVAGVAALALAAPACGGSSGSAAATSRRSPVGESPLATTPEPVRTTLDGTTGLPRFDNTRAMRDIRHLANDIGVRVRATRGERAGIGFVARRFRALGYNVHIQEFGVDGRRSHNVIAWWPGAQRYPLVVGAHIDTVRDSPGANDNASGIAVMLEAARIFAGRRQARWIRFVAFGSEEYGSNGRHHVGSQKYVRRLGEEGRSRLAGMISVDMVADGKPLIIGTAGIGPERVARTLYRKLRRSGISVTYKITCDCSDNGPFERAGMPASFMWSGSEPNYHDDSDRPANLEPKHVLRTGRAVRYFLRRVDKGMIRYFRDA